MDRTAAIDAIIAYFLAVKVMPAIVGSDMALFPFVLCLAHLLCLRLTRQPDRSWPSRPSGNGMHTYSQPADRQNLRQATTARAQPL